MQKASASISYICMIYVANASIAIRSLTSEMKPHYCSFFQLLGKKDILATLHPGPPPAESSSLGTQQRKTLGVLSSLAGAARQAGQGDDINRGLLYFTFFYIH